MLLEALDPARSAARAVVIEGEPGVGKTALWRRVLNAASAQRWRLLVTAPAASEAQLPFTALGDLLEPEAEDALAGLPGPQREALEIALLRRAGDLGATALSGRMIGVAALGALRALAARSPLLVAIDDMQWMDFSSAAALHFALRRLRGEQILVLATRRLEHRASPVPELARILGDERVVKIRLSPLSSGGVHELLRSRLGLSVSRSTLLRLHETTGGNPLFALEIGRELAARGRDVTVDEPLPVPGGVRELLRTRFERLTPPTQEVLLAAAALARPTRELLAGFSDDVDAALEEATGEGVLEVAGERVRFTHPLLASVHYEQAPLKARREVHRRLAGVVEKPVEAARHLALASSTADERVAAELERVAGAAARRGAPLEAAELCDLAARLTPLRGGNRQHRMLAAGEYYHRAGSLGKAADRAKLVLDRGAEPAARARALGLLGTIAGDTDSTDAAAELYGRAMREPGVAREHRADLHQKLAWISLVRADARLAKRHAHAMWRLLTNDSEREHRSDAALTLAHTIAAGGRAVPAELLVRAGEAEVTASPAQSWAWSVTGPAMLEGVVLLWSGELERARRSLERTRRIATDCEDPWLEMHALAYLSSVETHLGRPALGLELAERYLELAIASKQSGQRAGALWPVSVAAAWLGLTERAREAATEGLSLAEHSGHRLYMIGNLTALGAVELASGQPAAAARSLDAAWAIAHRGGIESPSRFPILPDAVEAFLAIDELERARTLAGDLRRIADALDRPWVRAQSARCDGLIRHADGDGDGALEQFELAIVHHAQQPRPLDHARTLLASGTVHRRMRRKRAARELLEQALAIFETRQARLWHERTKVELARIGGRRAAVGGTLSATESEIARLVSAGRTNREVAAALHLSDKTVEWNLSKLYRKLGVRSRTELASSLAAPAPRRTSPER